ncbi:hypothetical protein P7C73_g426, partial [Tremellales sp. Uapishka_1]
MTSSDSTSQGSNARRDDNGNIAYDDSIQVNGNADTLDAIEEDLKRMHPSNYSSTNGKDSDMGGNDSDMAESASSAGTSDTAMKQRATSTADSGREPGAQSGRAARTPRVKRMQRCSQGTDVQTETRSGNVSTGHTHQRNGKNTIPKEWLENRRS